MRKVFIICVLLILCVGCKVTMNVQRSGLRGSGDLGTTALIEGSKDPALWKAELNDVADAALKWLNTGEVDKMTADKLGKEFKKIVPQKYWTVVDMAMAALDSAKADPTAIVGKDNVARLKAFFTGMKTGAVEFDLHR